MNGKTSIAGMFAQGADGITNDMNRIVGIAETIPIPGREILQKLKLCKNPSGRPGAQLTMVSDPECLALLRQYEPTSNLLPENQPQPEPEPQPVVSGSILDFSSPANTIIKSLFFLSLSPMFSGTINFYIISVGCAGAIIHSLFKLTNR